MFAILLIVGAFVVMVNAPAHRQEVVLTLGSSAVLALIGWRLQKRQAAQAS
jgi:GABA permease